MLDRAGAGEDSVLPFTLQQQRQTPKSPGRSGRILQPITEIGQTLAHLEALTFSFQSEEKAISAVAIYSQPVETESGIVYVIREARESGFEGVACIDDTARAAILALHSYEYFPDLRMLRLARGWLTFLAHMQDSDGQFYNFVLDYEGRHNTSGITSLKGGEWWTARALWALAAAYRILGGKKYLTAFERCPLPTEGNFKIKAILALAFLELWQKNPQLRWRQKIESYCDQIVRESVDYLRDDPAQEKIEMWGYHQFLAVARAGRLLNREDYIAACRQTVETLIKPVIADRFYYVWPGDKKGQCVYCITPLVQGLSELYFATGEQEYLDLALESARWLYGNNDAEALMYDSATGRCKDGLTGAEVNQNCGAESSIEAGFIELECRLLHLHSYRYPLTGPISSKRSTDLTSSVRMPFALM